MGQSFSAEPVVEKHTETDKNDTFDVAVSSCQGWRFSQEDDHSLKIELPGEHKASFFAVFDGHGSAKVSKHASEGLWRHLTQNEMYIKGNFKEALEESFLSFDREVYESYNSQLAGTTAVTVLIVDNVIYCANIGDSRAVASVNCECVPLSHDHKPENPPELKRILAAGGYVLGNRVNGNLALSRAFGDFHYKSNEQLPADQQIVSPFPEINRIELNDDVDFILLACDGIWDVLTSEEVVSFVITHLEQEVRPDQICEQLTTRCLATDYELVIGCDNMTVLLICYTRGRSWSEYCTDIFNKNTKKLGVPNRTRTYDNSVSNSSSQQQQQQQHQYLNEDCQQRQGTSADLSRDSIMNSTFVTCEPSSDNDTSSITREGGGVPSTRELRNLFDVLQGLTFSNDNTVNPDDTPPITEVPAEEVETIHYDGDDATLKKAGDDVDDAKSKTIESDESAKIAVLDDKNEIDSGKQNDGENLVSSGTSEIHLSSPETGDSNEPIDTESKKNDDPKSEKSEGTIEITLSSPDEEEIGEDTNSDNDIDPVEFAPIVTEHDEFDDGITVEVPSEGDTKEAPTEEIADNAIEPETAQGDDANDGSSAADTTTEDS